MALSTYSEIREEILDEWEDLTASAYPEDIITELADGATPIYNGDIIAEWSEMPNEFDNTWQDGYSVSGSTTITELMAIDLGNYYRDTYLKIYNEILEEKESAE